MKKWFVFILLAITASLWLTACGSAGASTAQFHELSFQAPGNWIDEETSTTDSVDEGRMWHKDDAGTSWGLRDGGMFVFKMNYDFIGNLDVGLSGYEGDEIREAEAKMQASIKAVDGRVCARFMAETYSVSAVHPKVGDHEFTLKTRTKFDEKDFALENQNGCAVWSIERRDDRGKLYTCAVPYDDHVIAVAIASEGDDFSAEERAVIDSLSFAGEPGSEFYEIAEPMVGKTDEEALREVASTAGGLKAQTGTTSSSSPESSSSTYSRSASNNSHTATTGEKNALDKAKRYLDISAFSYSGLVEQLEFEGFTHSEAVYGADNCGADWNEQAARKAKQYLEMTPFSRSGLIEQLEFEGFTHSQAEYGVSKAY